VISNVDALVVRRKTSGATTRLSRGTAGPGRNLGIGWENAPMFSTREISQKPLGGVGGCGACRLEQQACY